MPRSSMQHTRTDQHSDDDEFSYERQIREHSDAEDGYQIEHGL